MKKISVALFSFVMCFMVSSVTFAGPDIVELYVSISEFAIGGVPVGASESYVKKIYGEPTDIAYDSYHNGSIRIYNYGNSFFIKFDDWGAFEIKSTANNGLKTPAGFTVGTPISKVEQYYGIACASYTDDNGKKVVVCKANWSTSMHFTVNNKGVVESIRVSQHIV